MSKDAAYTKYILNNELIILEWCAGGETGRGVICGGSARGWLPDVAAVLWRRMLAALGDPNMLPEPTLHLQVFQYLLHLNETLLKVRLIKIIIYKYRSIYRVIVYRLLQIRLQMETLRLTYHWVS